jgi:putative membrane protein
MKATHSLRAGAVLAVLLSCGVALAQTAGTGSSATGGGAAPAAQPGTGTRNAETRKDDALTRSDRKFVQKAAESGMFEVQVAQLASAKATDAQVKSFASMLVDHHTKANNELVQLANAKKVELPPGPPRGMRRDIEKLGKKSGAEFDRDFVREVGIKAHEKDIKLFEKAGKDLKDPELKAFAARTLPVLQEHLAQAQKLPQSGKADASTMGNTGGAAGTQGKGS